ncbi:MAG: hypothetical protein IJS47_05480 [Clostridia bacterium]|nr:hypothetical protein [Clostridia bacterium]
MAYYGNDLDNVSEEEEYLFWSGFCNPRSYCTVDGINENLSRLNEIFNAPDGEKRVAKLLTYHQMLFPLTIKDDLAEGRINTDLLIELKNKCLSIWKKVLEDLIKEAPQGNISDLTEEERSKVRKKVFSAKLIFDNLCDLDFYAGQETNGVRSLMEEYIGTGRGDFRDSSSYENLGKQEPYVLAQRELAKISREAFDTYKREHKLVDKYNSVLEYIDEDKQERWVDYVEDQAFNLAGAKKMERAANIIIALETGLKDVEPDKFDEALEKIFKDLTNPDNGTLTFDQDGIDSMWYVLKISHFGGFLGARFARDLPRNTQDRELKQSIRGFDEDIQEIIGPIEAKKYMDEHGVREKIKKAMPFFSPQMRDKSIFEDDDEYIKSREEERLNLEPKNLLTAKAINFVMDAILKINNDIQNGVDEKAAITGAVKYVTSQEYIKANGEMTTEEREDLASYVRYIAEEYKYGSKFGFLYEDFYLFDNIGDSGMDR